MKYQIQSTTNRSVGRKTWNLFSKLPLFIRGPLIRRLFTFDFSTHPDLVFKKAETYKEIEQAFQVAFEGFYERGLVEKTESRMRVTKFHALPTTSILIAKLGDEVIATVTVIVDSAMGLPLEKLWDINDIRKSSTRIAEISTLAIKKGFRSQRGKLLLPLCGFMYRFCHEFLGVDTFVAAYHPEVKDFYKCVLLFDDIADGEVKTYEFVQGAAAVAGVLKISELPKIYTAVYGSGPSGRNLGHFFTMPSPKNYIFGEKKYKGCSDFSLTPSLLEYFFRHKTDVMEQLSDQERKIIANSYFYPEYLSVISKGASRHPVVERGDARFSTYFNVRFHIEGSRRIYRGHALEVSKKGLKILSQHFPRIQPGQGLSISLELPDGQLIPLSADVSWTQPEFSQIGVRLKQFIPKSWSEMLEHFDYELVSRSQERQVLQLQSRR